MPAIKAFLFDLDGTLIDSLADLAGAINRMLADRGFPARDISLFPEFIGDGVRALVERALPDGTVDPDLIAECVVDYQRHYENCWHDQTRVYEGMLEVLVALKGRGLRIGCISNKPHHFTKLCCAHFFPEGTFELVLGHRGDVPKKPDPSGAFEAAQILGLNPGELAYVGDSGIDMQFAKSAGMHAIGVTWGFRSVEELQRTGADILVNQPHALLDVQT